MIKLSYGNMKLKDTTKTAFLQFNIPAVTTCPGRTPECERTCYAMKAQRQYPNVRSQREENLEATKSLSFVPLMITRIEKEMNRRKYKGKKIYFRIHESGDFYSSDYMKKWIDICKAFEGNNSIAFLAYTKSFDIWRAYRDDIPANMVIRHSLYTDASPLHKALVDIDDLPRYQTITPDERAGYKAHKGHVCPGSCDKCKACYHPSMINIACVIH